jgi:hypothetical protein
VCLEIRRGPALARYMYNYVLGYNCPCFLKGFVVPSMSRAAQVAATWCHANCCLG